MKWTQTELLRTTNITIDEDVEIDASLLNHNSGIYRVEDVHVSGTGFYDTESDQFYVDMQVSGVMICPDAINLEEVEVPFETDAQETYSFVANSEDEDARIVEKDEVDLLEAIVDAILLEVPLQVSNVDEEDYPEGDGWKVYSEEQYRKHKQEEIDPRLAILKEYKEED